MPQLQTNNKSCENTKQSSDFCTKEQCLSRNLDQVCFINLQATTKLKKKTIKNLIYSRKLFTSDKDVPEL